MIKSEEIDKMLHEIREKLGRPCRASDDELRKASEEAAKEYGLPVVKSPKEGITRKGSSG